MVDESYASGRGFASKKDSPASFYTSTNDLEALPLSEAHKKMLLTDSSISEDIIQEREYRSITDSAVLHRYGFGQAQCRLGGGLLIPTFDVRGNQHSAQFRADNPRTRRDGMAIKYETPKGLPMYLDVLPKNAAFLHDPKQTLWLTEGVKKSDALSSKGAVTIGLFGVWNWRGRNEYGGLTALADWDEIALKGREIVVAFDNDYRQKSSVLMAMNRLAAFLRRRGAIVCFINLPEGDKLGIDDYLAQGRTIDDVWQLKTDALPEIKRQTQAESLMAIAESRLQLLYTADGQRLATATYADGHREIYAIGGAGSSLRDWLITEYRAEHGSRLPSSSALSQAMEVIGAECRRFGTHADVFTRLAAHDGRLYLDLATSSWEAIEIDRDGWRVVKRPPVYFRRPQGMLPLPRPVEGGSMDQVAELLHIDPKSRQSILIQGWLVGVLHPTGPYPHLNLQGAQGSGKTVATRLLRSIVDPNVSATRLQPKESEDLVIAAMNGHIVGIENVSKLPPWLSDALCALSTGIGLSRRKKYTDDEETSFNAKRPAIVNGIAQVATRGDLIDRFICVELPGIETRERKLEAQIWKLFHEKHPGILGALLDAVSTALRRQGEVELGELPRMADVAHWIEAAAPSLGWAPGVFLGAYAEQKEDAIEVEIDSSPVALALLDYLRVNQKIAAASAADILVSIEPHRRQNGHRRPTKPWPESPDALGREFARIAPALERCGYRIERAPGSRRGGRKWRVIPIFDGDTSGDTSDGDSQPKCHQKPEVSPLVSPHNPLNDQNLGKNYLEGDTGDTFLSHYSVRRSLKRKKNVFYDPPIDMFGNEVSPVSPVSPSLPGDTQFDPALDGDAIDATPDAEEIEEAF